MRCRHFQDNIDAFIDGETDESVNARLIEHMETCAACKSLYKRRQSLFQTLKAEDRITDEIDVSDFVMEQINLLPISGGYCSYKNRILYVVLPVALAIGSLFFWKNIDLLQVVGAIGRFNRMLAHFYLWGESVAIPPQIPAVLNALRVIAYANIQLVVRIAAMILNGLPLKAPVVFLFMSITFFVALWCRKLSKRSSSLMVII